MAHDRSVFFPFMKGANTKPCLSGLPNMLVQLRLPIACIKPSWILPKGHGIP
jgi:hypothetical protein